MGVRWGWNGDGRRGFGRVGRWVVVVKDRFWFGLEGVEGSFGWVWVWEGPVQQVWRGADGEGKGARDIVAMATLIRDQSSIGM